MNRSSKFRTYVKPPVEGTCRICITTHHDVISIFGREGRRLQLAEKLDEFMSMKIYAWDSLPRSLCRICMECVLLTAKYSQMKAREISSQSDSENTESASENSISSNEEEPWDLSMKSKRNDDISNSYNLQ